MAGTIKVAGKALQTVTTAEVYRQQELNSRFEKWKVTTDRIMRERQADKTSTETAVWAKDKLMKHEIKENQEYLKKDADTMRAGWKIHRDEILADWERKKRKGRPYGARVFDRMTA